MTAPVTDELHEAQANCRFYVLVDEKYKAVFTEVGGLQAETTILPYEEGGNNGFTHQLPGRTKFGNITLKRGVTRSNDFYKWFQDVINGKIKRKHITIVLYNPKGEPILQWNFQNAFPVRWVGPQFVADGRTAAIESIEFAFDSMVVQ